MKSMKLNKVKLLDIISDHPRFSSIFGKLLFKFTLISCIKQSHRKFILSWLNQNDQTYQFRICVWLITNCYKLNLNLDPNFRPLRRHTGDHDLNLVNALYTAITKKTSSHLIHRVNEYDLLGFFDYDTAQKKLIDIYEQNARLSAPLVETNNYQSISSPSEIRKAGEKSELNKIDIALIKTCKLLEENDIRYFLVSGTLLRIMRENNLPESDDIDIGIFADEMPPETILEIIKAKKIRIIYYDPPYILNVMIENTSVDLFFHFETADSIWHGSDYHRWYNKKFEMSQIEYAGHKFSIPTSWNEYLVENYGDWKTPVSKFRIYLDCPNYKPQTNLDSFIYFLKKFLYPGNVYNEQDLSKISNYLLEIRAKLDMDTVVISD